MGIFWAGQSAGQLFGFASSELFRIIFFVTLGVTRANAACKDLTKGTNAANYLFWLKGLQPLITETPENSESGPKHRAEGIAFDAVKFCYPLRRDQPVLRGINLKVSQGILLFGFSLSSTCLLNSSRSKQESSWLSSAPRNAASLLLSLFPLFSIWPLAQLLLQQFIYFFFPTIRVS